jgi:hypothetical protein
MARLDDRTIANMDIVLEETCSVFPHGGDHERRRYIAHKLKLSARRGNTTLGGLRAVAHTALKEVTRDAPNDRQLRNQPNH